MKLKQRKNKNYLGLKINYNIYTKMYLLHGGIFPIDSPFGVIFTSVHVSGYHIIPTSWIISGNNTYTQKKWVALYSDTFWSRIANGTSNPLLNDLLYIEL